MSRKAPLHPLLTSRGLLSRHIFMIRERRCDRVAIGPPVLVTAAVSPTPDQTIGRNEVSNNENFSWAACLNRRSCCRRWRTGDSPETSSECAEPLGAR
jgi:hypothetical protein